MSSLDITFLDLNVMNVLNLVSKLIGYLGFRLVNNQTFNQLHSMKRYEALSITRFLKLKLGI